MVIQKNYFVFGVILVFSFLVFIFFSPNVNSKTKKVIKQGKTVRVIYSRREAKNLSKTCLLEKVAIEELEKKVEFLEKLKIENNNLREDNLNLKRQLVFYSTKKNQVSKPEKKEESVVGTYW